jgi:hypothetical protein
MLRPLIFSLDAYSEFYIVVHHSVPQLLLKVRGRQIFVAKYLPSNCFKNKMNIHKHLNLVMKMLRNREGELTCFLLHLSVSTLCLLPGLEEP